MTEKALTQFQAQVLHRRQIQQGILRLGQQRRMERSANVSSSLRNQNHSLGSAVIQVVREQIAQKGFTFDPSTSIVIQETQP
jgi:hypothetical protein